MSDAIHDNGGVLPDRRYAPCPACAEKDAEIVQHAREAQASAGVGGAPTCGLCGQPMPAGEEMFKYHGYSGPCPAPAPVAEPEPLGRKMSLEGDHFSVPVVGEPEPSEAPRCPHGSGVSAAECGLCEDEGIWTPGSTPCICGGTGWITITCPGGCLAPAPARPTPEPRLCADCGKAPADECFTVCSPCWDRAHPRPAPPADPRPVDVEALARFGFVYDDTSMGPPAWKQHATGEWVKRQEVLAALRRLQPLAPTQGETK